MTDTVHAIRCKKTGMAIATKLDGGTCVCPSAAECIMSRLTSSENRAENQTDEKQGEPEG